MLLQRRRITGVLVLAAAAVIAFAVGGCSDAPVAGHPAPPQQVAATKAAQDAADDPAFAQKVAEAKAAAAGPPPDDSATPSLKDTCPVGPAGQEAFGSGGQMGVGGWGQIIGQQCVLAWIVENVADWPHVSYYLAIRRYDASGSLLFPITTIDTPKLSFVKGSGDVMTMKDAKGQTVTFNLKTLKLTTHRG